MQITCQCNTTFQTRLVPCPDGHSGCLVAHYDPDSFECPSCGAVCHPKLKSIRVEVGPGIGNAQSLARLNLTRS